MLKKYYVILAATGFIVDDKNRLLIVKKSPLEMVDGGLWVVPGGKIEKKEAIIDGLHREIEEEVGLNVKVIDWIGEDVFENSGYHYHAQHFLCTPINKKVKLEKKLLDYRWIKKNEIDKFKFPVNIKKRVLQIL